MVLLKNRRFTLPPCPGALPGPAAVAVCNLEDLIEFNLLNTFNAKSGRKGAVSL
jgi:hypothetical protein